jgi:hypothetical protein
LKAIVFSVGEPTTDLCMWSLKRNGFDVILRQDHSSLWHKLNMMYHQFDEDLVRVDADVIPNNKFKPESFAVDKDVWWQQFITYDWWKQDIAHGGVNYIRREAFAPIRKHIQECQYEERPESYLYRLEEFHNPRRCVTVDKIMGIHGYGIDNVKRVVDTKRRRGQMANYDFELARKLNAL